ncbi:MAG: DNA recombination protein RmuC [Alistipes sp.]|nr:DNA recombination protein RmuC [Alistipes sp.]
MEYIIISVVMAAAVAVLAMLLRRSSSELARERDQHRQSERSLQEEIARERQLLVDERVARVRAESEAAALRERERTMQQEREQTEQTLARERERAEQAMKAQFRNLANEIFGEQSREFRQTNKESLDLLLKPFKDNISDFRERVERIYASENEQRGALKNELDNLMRLNMKITAETTNLTNALRGNSKVQGDWGEVYLETILSSTGLVKGLHYEVQTNLKDDDNRNLRPDVILRLPEERSIVIDSKVSLTAYVGYTAAESEEERRRLMAEHVASVRRHVQELAAKEYQRLLDSPDFVIMFIPAEPAFLEALKEDRAIWSDAYARKVIISSPTNLFALLKMVADMWRRDAQSKNQAEIVDKATKLYDQLVAFTESLEGVGTALDQARTKYDDAYKRLRTGNNNIVRLGERLRKLGLPTKKRQSAKALEGAEPETEAAAEQDTE